MTRDEFLRHLALTSMGTCLPEQVDALELSLRRNASVATIGLVQVVDVYVGGYETTVSTPTALVVRSLDTTIDLAFNALGGIVSWKPNANTFLPVASTMETSWRLRVSARVYGFIRVVCQDLMLRTIHINTADQHEQGWTQGISEQVLSSVIGVPCAWGSDQPRIETERVTRAVAIGGIR